MELDALIRAILAQEITPLAAEDEDTYHAAWLDQRLSFEAPFTMAARGGALADRLAWVFVAGYQATSRRVFPTFEPLPGWASFVNTEVSPDLPPTRLELNPDGSGVLSGWKTWVATSAHVSRLFVSSGPGRIPFAVVERDMPGVEIETSPRKSYLGDMTQGRVFFRNVVLPKERITGDPRTFLMFGASESAYVRVALHAFMLAHGVRLGAPTGFIARVTSNLYAADRVLGGDFPSELSALSISGVHLTGLALAADFETFIATADSALHARWMADRRLIDGVTAGLASRADRAMSALTSSPATA